MTVDELLAEGRRLARRCIYLRQEPNGTSPLAYWRGTSMVPAPDPYEHWLSFDGRAVPNSTIEGWVSILIDEENDSRIVTLDSQLQAPTNADGLPLFGYPDESLPPIEGIFMSDSPMIRDWLATNNWLPEGP